MDPCLESLKKLTYPNYEVVVVNDGSKDRTLEITERHGYTKIVSQENKGLSVARNVGMQHSTGEIIAYTDSDCVADPDWLTYMVAKMQAADLYACGGPNFPPPEDSLLAALPEDRDLVIRAARLLQAAHLAPVGLIVTGRNIERELTYGYGYSPEHR